MAHLEIKSVLLNETKAGVQVRGGCLQTKQDFCVTFITFNIRWIWVLLLL